MTAHQRISEAGQPVRHNLFLGIKPPPATAAKIGLIRDRAGDGEGRVRTDRLHVTILMIGRDMPCVPPDVVARADAAMAALTAEAFDLTFDRFRPNGGTLALFPRHQQKALRTLRQQSEALIAQAGLLAPKSRSFNPHMTLFYNPASPGTGRVAPIGWHVEEIVLIDSHIGLTKHVELARWPLIEQWRLL